MRSWFRRQLLGTEAPETAASPDAPETSQSSETKPEQKRTPSQRTRKAPAATGTKSAAAATSTKSAAAEKAAPRRAKAAKPETPDGQEAPPARKPRERRRRTETPRRSALPPVRKEMLVSVEVGEQRVAVLEDGQPVEVYLERPGRRSIAGNVYKGVVDNVLPGMEASFIEIGLEKNGFLYVDEIVTPELEGRRHARRIQDLISRGEEILVQAVKDPMGTKGARLTTEISLPGRFMVYTPFGDGIGVSRRLEDEERERLKALCRGLDLPEGGVIVRTAAEGASEEEIAGDLAFLRKLWATIRARAERAKAPSLVYSEADLPLRVVRDLFLRDFEHLSVDNERAYRRIVSYLKRTSPELASKVELYRGTEPLMERYGVDAAVRSTLSRRVDLPSGGYLVFDYAEAFTVVDVNTGRFVGARGKTAGARLEDTITKNNLEAAKEIVRQLRLRDIGGIIVIDFIDMANPKNRADVEEALKRELERDRTKTYVVEISPLGLVEMTRQNVTDGPREILTKRCPICEGNGVVVSEETYAVEAERRLRQLARSSADEAFLVELPGQVAGILIGPAGSRLAELERETGKLYAFETRDDLPADHFRLVAHGSAAEIEPQALPVSTGAELDVLLEEVHMHHPGDAIARLDGYVVAVAGAAPSVGKTVRVRIERATRTVAYAVLAGAVAEEAPIEPGELAEAAEMEGAPKRTRRRAPARAVSAEVEVAEAPPPVEEAAEGEVAGEGARETPKRKTRRGTRGGRGRRKKTVAAPSDGLPGEAVEAEPAETAGAEAAEPELIAQGDGEAPKRPSTRRGTRGGRGRKAAPGEPLSESPAEAGPREPIEQAGQPVDVLTEEPGEGAATPKRKTRRGTRGGRGRKKTSGAGAASNGAGGEEEAAQAVVAVALPSANSGEPSRDAKAESEPNGDAPSEGATPPPRRTRRGTRGGRGRRGATASAAAADEVAAPESATG